MLLLYTSARECKLVIDAPSTVVVCNTRITNRRTKPGETPIWRGVIANLQFLPTHPEVVVFVISRVLAAPAPLYREVSRSVVSIDPQQTTTQQIRLVREL